MVNASNAIGLATFEIEIYAVDRRFYKDKEGKDQHINQAFTSVGALMISDEVFDALRVASPNTPSTFVANAYTKDGATKYSISL